MEESGIQHPEFRKEFGAPPGFHNHGFPERFWNRFPVWRRGDAKLAFDYTRYKPPHSWMSDTLCQAKQLKEQSPARHELRFVHQLYVSEPAVATQPAQGGSVPSWHNVPDIQLHVTNPPAPTTSNTLATVSPAPTSPYRLKRKNYACTPAVTPPNLLGHLWGNRNRRNSKRRNNNYGRSVSGRRRYFTFWRLLRTGRGDHRPLS